MTTVVTDNVGTHLDNSTNQQKLNATKSPKGRAVLGPGNRVTPEASLGPDDARNEADLNRNRAQIDQSDNPLPSIEEDTHEDSTTRSQPPDSDDNEEQKDKEEVNVDDVLKCKSDDYYGILGISDKYDNSMLEISAIEKAVWDRGTSLHPKFNRDERAKEAFQMVCDAGRALGCSEIVLDEVNNWDGAGEGDDENADGMNGIEGEGIPWPREFVSNIYKEATTDITALQRYPRLASIHKRLDGFNDQIRTQNAKDGIDPDEGLIDYKTLLEKYEKIGLVFRHLDDYPNDTMAVQQGMELNTDLEQFLERNKYPNHWEGKSENYKVMKQPRKPKATPKASASSTAPAPIPLAPVPSTAIPPQAKASTPSTTLAPTPTSTILPVPKPKPSSSTNTTNWRPGLTEKGERILAMAPVERMDATRTLRIMECKFVVEKRGEANRIAFEDSAKIGDKAAIGYLEELPEADRVDIRCKANVYSTKDQAGFRRIVGVTAVESENPRIFPPIALAAEYDYGLRVINRTGWRDIWKSKADRMIEDFFLSHGLDIPWVKRAKRPGCSQYPEHHNGPDRSRSPRYIAKGRDSEAPGRRRSSSVRSTASYLSDEGLARLEAVEKKLENLAGMEDRLMKSHQEFMESATAKFTAAMEGLMAQMSQMRTV